MELLELITGVQIILAKLPSNQLVSWTNLRVLKGYKGSNKVKFSHILSMIQSLLKNVCKIYVPKIRKRDYTLRNTSRRQQKDQRIKRATMSENTLSDMCAQRRFRSACANAQADQNLH